MRTSYSAIETYLQCPQKYKFQEIDHIRVPKSKEAIFGTLVHDTLKFMFQKDPLFPTLDEILAYFRERWIPDPKILTDAEKKIYLEEGLKMLKNFYQKNLPWNFSIVDLESRFEVVMTDEKSGQNHILVGKIDRIDKLADGSYEIIDYKTGKRMPSQESLKQNLQLSLYSLGLQKRWPHLEDQKIKLSLYFLKHGEKLSTLSETTTARRAQNHVLETINQILDKLKAEKGFEPMPGPLCDWCGYKPMCPAWRHLYKKIQQTTLDDILPILKEYFAIKNTLNINEERLAELQNQIREYMEKEGLTRVFNNDGYISKKIQQRFEYDWEKIKTLLTPLGKWEEILKADETKLKRVLLEIPENIREEVEDSRQVKKEFTVLTASMKKMPRNDEEKTEI